jgi:hypothetical protein
LPVAVQTTTDAAGAFSLSLFQNEAGTLSSHYQLRFTDAETGLPIARRQRIYVPAISAADVDDILLTDDNPPLPASGPVRSFNTRVGAVTLQASDISGAGGALASGVVSVVDAIMSASASGLVNGTTIFARGRSSANDGAGGVFTFWASSTNDPDGGLIFTPSGTTGAGRFVRHGYTVFGFAGVANAQWFGMVADCTGFTGTDNTSALALALASCPSLQLPPDRFLFNNNAAAQLKIKRSIKVQGAGRNQTILAFNDDASTTRRDLLTSDGLGAWNVELCDFGIEGSWGNGGSWATRSHLMELAGMGDVTLSNIHAKNSRFMGLVVTGCRDFIATGCNVENTVADGIRVTAYRKALVSFSRFQSVNDDAIAIHSPDATAAPTECSAVVYGNVLTDSQGITVLGSKNLTVAANVLTRPHCRAIFVGQDDAYEEGNTPLIQCNITGNVIDTLFSGQAFSAASGALFSPITVSAGLLGAVPGGGYPGRPNGSGGIVPVFPYLYLNNTDEGGLNAGLQNVSISGNQVTRSLAPVGAYSDYGFGTRLGRSGPVDPAITGALLGVGVSGFGCIAAIGGANHINVHANQLTCGYALSAYFSDGPTTLGYSAFLSGSFKDNECSGFTQFGVFFDASGSFRADGNHFSGDPFHTAATRQAGGKWASSGGPIAIYAAQGSSVQATNNHYRHVFAVSGSGESATIQHSGETIYAQPAGIGWNANNAGIGTIPRPAEIGAILVIEDANPSSSTYGKVLSRCPSSTSAMPSTGTWVAGMFVGDSSGAQVTHGGKVYIRHGWSRRTTGSSNILNTDWAEVLAPVEV